MKVTSAARQPAPHGGQASVSTFGYASFLAPAAVPGSSTPHRGDEQPRRIGGLTYRQRRASIFRGLPESVILSMRKASAEITVPVPAPAPPEAAQVAATFLRVCKARPLVAGFNADQFQEWLDENYAEAVAHQARMADLATGADDDHGLGQPSATAQGPRPSTRVKGALTPRSNDGPSAVDGRRPAAAGRRVKTAAAPPRHSDLSDEPELAHSRWLADLAESYGCFFDEETAAYARSFAGTGYAEHLMALEG